MKQIGTRTAVRAPAALALALIAHIAMARTPAPQAVVDTPSERSVDRQNAHFLPAATTHRVPLDSPLASEDDRPTTATSDPREVECIAKVVLHEAGNQPLRGQRAVAQVILARMKDGRFARTACGVVKQRGQFFDVEAYDPRDDDARWTTAVKIATEALAGGGEDVAGGALFFHAAGSNMAGRTRIVQIADHTFYR